MTAPTSPPAKLKLLFADDERSLQEVMRLELPRMGHEVTVCPDGVTALAALDRKRSIAFLSISTCPAPTGWRSSPAPASLLRTPRR